MLESCLESPHDVEALNLPGASPPPLLPHKRRFQINSHIDLRRIIQVSPNSSLPFTKSVYLQICGGMVENFPQRGAGGRQTLIKLSLFSRNFITGCGARSPTASVDEEEQQSLILLMKLRHHCRHPGRRFSLDV